MSSVSQFCTTVRQDDMSCFLEVEVMELRLKLSDELCVHSETLSGAGLNLKLGAHVRRKALQSDRKIFGRAPPLFALQVQLVVLVSAFVMVSTVWSVSCLLFFYSRCLPCPAICKGGGHVPPCSMESAPLKTLLSSLKSLFLCFKAVF